MNMFKYENEVTDSYYGQSNCSAFIYCDNKIIGGVDYVLYDGELTISNIITRPEWRRKGIASRLVKYIKLKNPEYTYIPSMKTEDGSKFIHKDLSLEEKLVYESISDVLKPKSEDEIIKELSKLTPSKLGEKLLDAAWKNDCVMIKLLIKAGVNINYNNPKINGCNALIYAVSENNLEAVKLLLKYKINVNARDNENQSVLLFASKYSNIYKLLKQYGAKE